MKFASLYKQFTYESLVNKFIVSTEYFSSTPVRHDTVKTRHDFVKTVPDRDSRSRTADNHKDQVKIDVSHAEDQTAAEPQVTQVPGDVDSPEPQSNIVMTPANWTV